VEEIGSRLRFDAARIMNPFDLGLSGRQHYIANVESLARDPEAAALIVFGLRLRNWKRQPARATRDGCGKRSS
jgi:hypothetical protein